MSNNTSSGAARLSPDGPHKDADHIHESTASIDQYPRPFLSRFAMRIRGRDEHGRERVIALDWDGRWHDLSPGRPEPQSRTQRADQFNVGDRAVLDGVVWTRVKSDVSLGLISFATPNDNVMLVDADHEMEVAP